MSGMGTKKKEGLPEQAFQQLQGFPPQMP